MRFCIFFCSSILLTRLQSELISITVFKILIIFALIVFFLWHRFRQFQSYYLVVLAAIFGFCYANVFAYYQLQQQLPEKWEKVDLVIKATITGLPKVQERYQHIEVNVVEEQQKVSEKIVLKKLLLNVYTPQNFRPCDLWQFTVRLKRPHSLGNPDGFDYEAFLLEQGVQGKGYAIHSQLLERNTEFCIDAIRQTWGEYVLAVLPKDTAAWLLALSTGDNSHLSDVQNDLLQETGTTHLFVISGSHISLCAVVIYFLLMGLRKVGLGRVWWAYGQGDWRPLVALVSLLGAGFYAELAGFGIPAQRALIMLTVFLGTQIVGLQWSLWLRYWLSMTLVLLMNPLSALNVGFILSFVAVFILILITESFKKQKFNTLFKRLTFGIKGLLVSQVAIFVGLTPIILLYFSTFSYAATLVNIIAIPYTTFLTVPTVLLAFVIWCVFGVDWGLLHFAQIQLDFLFSIIHKLNDFFIQYGLKMISLSLSTIEILVLVLSSVLLLIPKVFQVRFVGLLLLLSVFYHNSVKAVLPQEFKMDVIDVDQGLAVLIQTENHQMVFDVGSAWPGGSMVDRAVAPYLQHYGIKNLDKVMISHLDNDHVGAVKDLPNAVSIEDILSSEPIQKIHSNPCRKGQYWIWDNVKFTVLHPEDPNIYPKRNNRSCVLLIEVAGKKILVPGDIEALVEQKLLDQGLPAIDVMIAAHHGSKTSSIQAWVDNVKNGIVIYSSGYLSQFHHPHPSIVQRYKSARVKSFNTALQGAITVKVSAKGELTVSSWREKSGKYWNKINRMDNW